MFTDLVLENQFGEVSQNKVLAGSSEGLPIAAKSVLANNTTGSALPSGLTFVQLTAAQVLTGYTSGAGTVSATDNLLQAIQKLNGNAVAIKTTADAALPSASFTSAAVTAKVLTGLGAGSNTAIASTDTILEALAKLQAQIAAL